MLIIGAKGFAKEVLEILHQNETLENLVFYDDVNSDIGTHLYNKFPILKTKEAVKDYFENVDDAFTIGIGDPHLRFKMYTNFKAIKGDFITLKSPFSRIGSYDVIIGEGSILMDYSIISNNVSIGKGCIVYYNSTITHDCEIGAFVEISPSVNLLGNVKVGKFSQIGANSTVLPKVSIGKNVIIGAGSLVTKDIPDNCLAFGVPARIIKQY